MKTTANMATHPPRRKSSIDTINSLYDQVDLIRIYLNEYDEIPPEYVKEKIEIYHGGENLKSTGKLFWATNPDEYYFCVDDDIVYPHNYVKNTVERLNFYGDDVLVSYHGRKYKKNTKIQNYFKDFEEYYLFKKEKIGDSEVDVIGNGVSCWNTNKITIDWKKFKFLYMDDILVSMQAHQQNKRRIVLSHPENFFKFEETDEHSLFSKYVKNHETQTTIFNSIDWWG